MSAPVLFVVFRRPEKTARVFEAIRAARPMRLYVAADAPRQGHPGEAECCEATRRIATAVDWPCRLETLFRTQNLGCREGPRSAIDWFFEQEEAGIILEDDCLPSPSFFTFCNELLLRFRDDARIMHITGNNFQRNMDGYPFSYFFSRHMHQWGWASWRRAWKMYDRHMDSLGEFREIGGLNGASFISGYAGLWERRFQAIEEGLDAWDFQWLLTCWTQNGLTCAPRVNLVRNIGFDSEATHTVDPRNQFGSLPIGELELPLSHPSVIAPHHKFDTSFERLQMEITGFAPPSASLRSAAGRVVRRGLAVLRGGAVRQGA